MTARSTAVIELVAESSGNPRLATANASALWVAAALYASRASLSKIAILQPDSGSVQPTYDKVAQTIELARYVRSAWPSNPYASLGDEVEAAWPLVSDRMTVGGSLKSSDSDTFSRSVRGHRLAASTTWPYVDHEGFRAGFSLQPLDANLADNSSLYEQLILHELLTASDYFAALHGEALRS